MKQLWAILLLPLLLALGGCSDDDNPAGGNQTTPQPTSVWNSNGNYWSSQVDASNYTDFMYFSFTTRDTVTTGVPKPSGALADVWDVGFRREVIKLNGGASSNNGGDCEAADLGQVDFAAVTMADTAGVSWESDNIDYFIDSWYDYNPTTHQLTANQYVYSMRDASGEHYVKFRVDSLVGAGMPPTMGTVHISYFYQATANSLSLDGTILQAAINVGSGTGYFYFSTGAQVTPADPANSTEWDIAFNSYNIFQNSGPSGIGACAAFQAYTQMSDPTDLAGFTMQPAVAPLFPDIPGSGLTDWYNYANQKLSSKSHIYLIRTEGKIYKLRIDSYYSTETGVSAHYFFVWSEL